MLGRRCNRRSYHTPRLYIISLSSSSFHVVHYTALKYIEWAATVQCGPCVCDTYRIQECFIWEDLDPRILLQVLCAAAACFFSGLGEGDTWDDITNKISGEGRIFFLEE